LYHRLKDIQDEPKRVFELSEKNATNDTASFVKAVNHRTEAA